MTSPTVKSPDEPTTGSPRSTRRLGFAVKVAGRLDLKDHDSRRWQNEPHLRVSIEYLDRIFDYLAEHQIRMYRMSSDLAPYITHPDLPRFHSQIDESRDALSAIGEKARQLDFRLSMHPAQYIVLNSPDERIAAAAGRDFRCHAELIDAMGVGLEAKIITHVGGVYGDRKAAADRFVRRYLELPVNVQNRLVLENDEVSWSVEDVLEINRRTGVPLVFDNLHHAVNNRSNLAAPDALREFVATWPPDQIPKIHFSSQRREDRVLSRRDRSSGVTREVAAKAKPGQHDDWIDAAEFVALLDGARDLHFDVMLEAKQKQLAMFQLREALAAEGRGDIAW